MNLIAEYEFVDAAIHRLGEHVPKGTRRAKPPELDGGALLAAVEAATGIPTVEICGRGKAPRITHAKETLILCGHRLGANMAELARLTGLDISTVTHRFEAAATAHAGSYERRGLSQQVMERYQIERIATSQVSPLLFVRH